MTMKRRTMMKAAAIAAVAAPSIARGQGAAIRIGEINSYTAQPAFLAPYRNGWNLAIEEANAAGGVNGRRLETVFRDDAGKPEDAVRLYVASEPLSDALVWGRGNRYTFRLRPSTYMQAAMLAEEAAKVDARRWAIVSPNYEYGQSAAKWFKELLVRAKPGVEFVAEQFPALGRIDAGATVQAIEQSRPDAIFNVTFGGDLTNFVRQGNTRGLFEKRFVASMLTGEPEYMDPLKDECPEGWVVTGYPWDQIQTANHRRFREAYQKRFNDYPRLGSVVGYDTVVSIVAMLRKSGGTETEKMVDAMKGLSFESAFGEGPVLYRALDHQSTLGAYVGKTALKGGKGTMVGWRYADGAKYLPSDDVVRTLRPQG